MQKYVCGAAPIDWPTPPSPPFSPLSSTPQKNRPSVCQIFYELKGGRVNYGKGHSHRYGHEPEGEEEHEGLFPEVSDEHACIGTTTHLTISIHSVMGGDRGMHSCMHNLPPLL